MNQNYCQLMDEFFLISEENTKEMYEDVYRTKSNSTKIE